MYTPACSSNEKVTRTLIVLVRMMLRGTFIAPVHPVTSRIGDSLRPTGVLVETTSVEVVGLFVTIVLIVKQMDSLPSSKPTRGNSLLATASAALFESV